MKVEAEANELTDADVTFISLVPAGANRAAFKVMKSDDANKGGKPVLDFTKTFIEKLDRDADGVSDPTVLAILVDTSVDKAKATEALKAAGFDVEHPAEAEGAHVFLQGEGIELGTEETGIYKASDQLAAVVDKRFEPFQGSTSFTENLNARGFFPSFSMAQAVLDETVFAVAEKASSPDEMANGVEAATSEFQAAVTNMARSLPSEVFKLDPIKLDKAEMAAGSTDGKEDPAAGEQVPATGPNAETEAQRKGAQVAGVASKGVPSLLQIAKGVGIEAADLVIEPAEGGVTLKSKAGQEMLNGPGINIFVRVDTTDGLPPSSEVNPSASEAEFSSADGVDRTGNFSADAPVNSSLPDGGGSVAKSGTKKKGDAEGTAKPSQAEGVRAAGSAAVAAPEPDEAKLLGIVTAGVAKGIAPVAEAVQKLEIKIAEIEKSAEETEGTAERAMRAVFGEAQSDFEDITEKADYEGEPPLLDTGMAQVGLQ